MDGEVKFTGMYSQRSLEQVIRPCEKGKKHAMGNSNRA